MYSDSFSLQRVCYGYTRVSTFKQKNMGSSMVEQKIRIERYCQFYNCSLVEVVTEPAISGSAKKRTKRKKLTALLNRMPPNSFLIVIDVTRLSRSLADFMIIFTDLMEKKCHLIAIDQSIDSTTDSGQFTLQLMALLGQQELRTITTRIENMRKHKEENAQFMGRIPYGWRTGGKDKPAIEIPEEQAVVKYAYELASEVDKDGKRIYTDYAIAKRFNELNIKPPGKAKEWSGINITRMFNRKQLVAQKKTYQIEDLVNYVPLADKGLPIVKPESEELYFKSLKEFETDFFNKLIADFPESDSE